MFARHDLAARPGESSPSSPASNIELPELQIDMPASAASAAARPLFSYQHHLGLGLRVQFVALDGVVTEAWRPRPPSRQELRRYPEILARYTLARNAFVRFLTARAEAASAVVENAT